MADSAFEFCPPRKYGLHKREALSHSSGAQRITSEIQVNETPLQWDFFLAHAAADAAVAEQLYDCLTVSASVFLDTRSLELGDNWDIELPKAQQNSLITLVLVTPNLDAAYYQRVEVASAINLSRDPNQSHRVIPIYLNEASTKGLCAQYGLNLKQGVVLSSSVSLEIAALRLLGTLKRLRYKRLLFDTRAGKVSHVVGYADTYWSTENGQPVRSSTFGDGKLTIEPSGTLAIERSSNEGRYVLHLLAHPNQPRDQSPLTFSLPDTQSDSREIWIHCEARTDGSEHGMRFILRDDAASSWLVSEKRSVVSSEWTDFDIYFRIKPTTFSFRLAFEEPSAVPSHAYIRRIVIREL